MDLFVSQGPLSVHEREQLAGLLAALPDGRGWEVRHMHGPLLCALGLLEPPDDAYAHAAHRRFAEPAQIRQRAIALLSQLDRDARIERVSRARRRPPSER